MPLTPGRFTSKIRQLGPSTGFLSRNFSAVSKPSDRKPADFSSPCIDARMLASSSTTNTVAVFAGAIGSPIVMPCLQIRRSRFEIWIAREIWGTSFYSGTTNQRLKSLMLAALGALTKSVPRFAPFLKRIGYGLDRREGDVTRWTKRSVLFRGHT